MKNYKKIFRNEGLYIALFMFAIAGGLISMIFALAAENVDPINHFFGGVLAGIPAVICLYIGIAVLIDTY